MTWMGWFCVALTAGYLITNHIVLPLYTKPLDYYWNQWYGHEGVVQINEAKVSAIGTFPHLCANGIKVLSRRWCDKPLRRHLHLDRSGIERYEAETCEDPEDCHIPNLPSRELVRLFTVYRPGCGDIVQFPAAEDLQDLLTALVCVSHPCTGSLPSPGWSEQQTSAGRKVMSSSGPLLSHPSGSYLAVYQPYAPCCYTYSNLGSTTYLPNIHPVAKGPGRSLSTPSKPSVRSGRVRSRRTIPLAGHSSPISTRMAN